jgi:hypothetical protein
LRGRFIGALYETIMRSHLERHFSDGAVNSDPSITGLYTGAHVAMFQDKIARDAGYPVQRVVHPFGQSHGLTYTPDALERNPQTGYVSNLFEYKYVGHLGTESEISRREREITTQFEKVVRHMAHPAYADFFPNGTGFHVVVPYGAPINDDILDIKKDDMLERLENQYAQKRRNGHQKSERVTEIIPGFGIAKQIQALSQTEVQVHETTFTPDEFRSLIERLVYEYPGADGKTMYSRSHNSELYYFM